MRAIILTAYVTALLAGPICQVECLPFALADASAAEAETGTKTVSSDCPHHQPAESTESALSNERPSGHRDAASEAVCLDQFLSAAQAPSSAPDLAGDVLLSVAWSNATLASPPATRAFAGLRPEDQALRPPPPKIYLRDLRLLN